MCATPQDMRAGEGDQSQVRIMGETGWIQCTAEPPLLPRAADLQRESSPDSLPLLAIPPFPHSNAPRLCPNGIGPKSVRESNGSDSELKRPFFLTLSCPYPAGNRDPKLLGCYRPSRSVISSRCAASRYSSWLQNSGRSSNIKVAEKRAIRNLG